MTALFMSVGGGFFGCVKISTQDASSLFPNSALAAFTETAMADFCTTCGGGGCCGVVGASCLNVFELSIFTQPLDTPTPRTTNKHLTLRPAKQLNGQMDKRING